MLVFIICLFFLIQQIPSSFSTITKNQFRQCVQQAHATKDDVALIRRKELPESAASKCLLSCILEVEGIMKKGIYDNKLGRKLGLKAYPKNKEKLAKALQILEDCGSKGITAKEPCEAAYQLALCTTSLSEQLKL